MNYQGKRRIYVCFVKRALDVLLACILLFLLLPVFLFTAPAVRIRLGSPVFFKQERGGLGGKSFVIFKFRTMTDDKDKNGELLPDDKRLTRFGRFLRRTSIDELPQLWNILRGEMSFVGPRPQLSEFLPHYTEEEKLRHSARPGLTGLAQVSGRNALRWKKRFELDLFYVEKVSFWLDLKILFLTFGALFVRNNDSDIESFYDR